MIAPRGGQRRSRHRKISRRRIVNFRRRQIRIGRASVRIADRSRPAGHQHSTVEQRRRGMRHPRRRKCRPRRHRIADRIENFRRCYRRASVRTADQQSLVRRKESRLRKKFWQTTSRPRKKTHCSPDRKFLVQPSPRRRCLRPRKALAHPPATMPCGAHAPGSFRPQPASTRSPPGSKISAAFVAAAPVNPPATSTLPSINTVAECALRAVPIGGAATKEPVVSKISALATGPAPLSPPLIRILPSCNNADAAPLRAAVIDPAASQLPIGGLRDRAFYKNSRGKNYDCDEGSGDRRTTHWYAPGSRGLGSPGQAPPWLRVRFFNA